MNLDLIKRSQHKFPKKVEKALVISGLAYPLYSLLSRELPLLPWGYGTISSNPISATLAAVAFSTFLYMPVSPKDLPNLKRNAGDASLSSK